MSFVIDNALYTHISLEIHNLPGSGQSQGDECNSAHLTGEEAGLSGRPLVTYLLNSRRGQDLFSCITELLQMGLDVSVLLWK